MLLLTHGVPTFDRFRDDNLGLLMQPRCCSNIEGIRQRPWLRWAADNDAFGNFNADAYRAMLDKLAGLPNGLFVTVPDVVGDAEATLDLFWQWFPALAARDLPIGFVAQDGLESLTVPWWAFDALFIGGTTEWKLSAHARALTDEAHRRGKWVHMGRVNSIRRMKVARAWGCDSVDGSSHSMFLDTYVPRTLRLLNAPLQPDLLGGVA